MEGSNMETTYTPPTTMQILIGLLPTLAGITVSAIAPSATLTLLLESLPQLNALYTSVKNDLQKEGYTIEEIEAMTIRTPEEIEANG
jgi:hypothetical protein